LYLAGTNRNCKDSSLLKTLLTPKTPGFFADRSPPALTQHGKQVAMTRKRKEERWRQLTRELTDADVGGMGAASLLVAGSGAGG
jgi:hypothetical protein